MKNEMNINESNKWGAGEWSKHTKKKEPELVCRKCKKSKTKKECKCDEPKPTPKNEIMSFSQFNEGAYEYCKCKKPNPVKKYGREDEHCDKCGKPFEKKDSKTNENLETDYDLTTETKKLWQEIEQIWEELKETRRIAETAYDRC